MDALNLTPISLDYKPNVQQWCDHCLDMGIRATEDFAHAVYYCPQVQYILHEVQSILKLE